MTEVTIDAYLIKIYDLETLCNDPLTTSTNLNTYFNELTTIKNIFNIELETLPFPTTTQHLRKLIYIEVETNNNSFIQSNLLKLIDIKKNYIDQYIETNYPLNNPIWDPNDRLNFSLNYENDIKSIISTIKNIINNCNCMRNRQSIIENINCLDR